MAMEAEKTYIRPEIWTEQCGKAVRVDLPCRRRNKTEHRAFFFSAKDSLRPVCDCSPRQNRGPLMKIFARRQTDRRAEPAAECG